MPEARTAPLRRYLTGIQEHPLIGAAIVCLFLIFNLFFSIGEVARMRRGKKRGANEGRGGWSPSGT